MVFLWAQYALTNTYTQYYYTETSLSCDNVQRSTKKKKNANVIELHINVSEGVVETLEFLVFRTDPQTHSKDAGK